FFQAEDGIRDFHVTGVQTCALPICSLLRGTGFVRSGSDFRAPGFEMKPARGTTVIASILLIACLNGTVFTLGRVDRLRTGASLRSEERRVGKECRSRWWR